MTSILSRLEPFFAFSAEDTTSDLPRCSQRKPTGHQNWIWDLLGFFTQLRINGRREKMTFLQFPVSFAKLTQRPL
jgi:hypothetical protein